MLRSAGIVLERAREINSACKTISGEFLERISTTGSKRNANCSLRTDTDKGRPAREAHYGSHPHELGSISLRAIGLDISYFIRLS